MAGLRWSSQRQVFPISERLGQRLQEPAPVLVILEDGYLPATAIHGAADRSGILNAQLPSRARIRPQRQPGVKETAQPH